jgi:ribonuclease E
VSSVALQLLRSIEEMLLKGPTHNLIIRTRPEIALYVLNHKRAHLRQMEEHFPVTLTVNSDEEVGGQIGFTIDRGEQVMTIEQAKALLAQAALAAPALHEDAEPDFPEEVDEEAHAEADTEATEGDTIEHGGNVDEIPDEGGGDDQQPMHGARDNGDGSRDGRGRTRRRRRRGRGGRGGEGRDGAPFQPRPEHGSPEPGAFAHDPAQGLAPQHGEERAEGEMQPGQDFAQPHPAGGDVNGDGEPRRRRRGRRGGRRNRRDGNGNGEFIAPQAHETQGQETHQRPDFNERPDWTPPREMSQPEATDIPHAESAPRPEPAPQAVAAQASQPAPEAAPPRRRSTVREPAPVFGGSAPVEVPMPPPAPAVTATADADASKPKRSGWWAKRLLGGD